MKETNILKLTCMTMFAAIVGLILVSGTYAKYVSQVSGSDTATVAKWDIKAGKKDEELAITGSNSQVAFDLFETILDESGSEEVDVISGKIAPGTMGSFEFSIKNDSEVNAEYTVSFVIDETTLPLEFRINDGEWTSDLNGVPTTRIEMGTSTVANVQWRWAYERTNGDEVDTALGITPKEINVTATLEVSQVD